MSKYLEDLITHGRLPTSISDVSGIFDACGFSKALSQKLLPLVEVRSALCLAPGASPNQTTNRTKLFGYPDGRLGETWPEIHGKPARFLAQLDCRELSFEGIPKAGLLRFFDNDDYPGVGLVTYCDEITEYYPIPIHDMLPKEDIVEEIRCALVTTQSIVLPEAESPVVDELNLGEDEFRAYDDFLYDYGSKLFPSLGRSLVLASCPQDLDLRDAGVAVEDCLVLFCLDSSDGAFEEYSRFYHPSLGRRVYFLIERSKLNQGDFSDVHLLWGES